MKNEIHHKAISISVTTFEKDDSKNAKKKFLNYKKSDLAKINNELFKVNWNKVLSLTHDEFIVEHAI